MENKCVKLHDIAESQIKPAFIKFMCATIETLPHGLLDELLQTTLIKSMKSKMFEKRLEPIHEKPMS